MDIQADINWIKAELDKVKDPDFIQVIKSLLNYRQKSSSTDWWDEISQEEREEINEGIRQADDEELIDHDKQKEKYQRWL